MSSASLPEITVSPELLVAAQKSKAWDFQEAAKIVKRYQKSGYPETVLFETGYGPSGLPHIGTFGEVSRTVMVINAFRVLTEDKVPVRLLCFSDDMDGMRKIPTNVPNPEILEANMGKPLTDVPDPFGEYESFAHQNNARLRAFLDRFGFSYEFASSTEYYKSGKFDDMLKLCVEKYDAIMGVMLPTLGAERQATYSPFLPISPSTGRVLYVPMKSVNAADSTITFDDEDGTEVTMSVTGGNVKLQWKPDFGMRWAGLSVDFEMYGKDHHLNSKVYSRICSILGARPPEQFCYELFLDENGEKISKSKGNGITIEQWLTYAPSESLSLFMYQKPKTAKRLHFDVIPRQVDEYFQHLAAYEGQSIEQRLQNPVWHVHNGNPPKANMPISFSMLLNLVSASNAEDKETLWGFISTYADGVSPQTHPKLDELVGFAIAYFRDFVKPNKKFRVPTEAEAKALATLDSKLAAMDASSDGDTIQTEVFSVGKEHEYENLRQWFQALYQILLGQDQGPRFGSFIALYGIDATRTLIAKALKGELAN
ncbi:MAG: lysine--tRNA ligase [Rhizobiales bacterium]|nr:lysine--tRNA ligase [Hyphomicrobiales bacterium]